MRDQGCVARVRVLAALLTSELSAYRDHGRTHVDVVTTVNVVPSFTSRERLICDGVRLRVLGLKPKGITHVYPACPVRGLIVADGNHHVFERLPLPFPRKCDRILEDTELVPEPIPGKRWSGLQFLVQPELAVLGVSGPIALVGVAALQRCLARPGELPNRLLTLRHTHAQITHHHLAGRSPAPIGALLRHRRHAEEYGGLQLRRGFLCGPESSLLLPARGHCEEHQEGSSDSAGLWRCHP